jgi:hypothetical protein
MRTVTKIELLFRLIIVTVQKLRRLHSDTIPKPDAQRHDASQHVGTGC